jgi:hypothetical protein
MLFGERVLAEYLVAMRVLAMISAPGITRDLWRSTVTS